MKEITPFSMGRRAVTSAVQVDPENASEITPMVRFGLLLPGMPVTPVAPNLSPNHQVADAAKEVEKSTEDDPKVSSVIDNASLSPSGIVESGQNETDQTQAIHPSTLSANPEDPAPVEKVMSLPPLLPIKNG